MGWGDELMAAGQAARIHRATGRSVCIVDRNGAPRWSPVWEGLPFISRNVGQAVEVLRNGPGCRPYIAGDFTAAGHAYSDWRARDHRPVLVLTEAERALRPAKSYVLIESTIKAGANPNKRWWSWQQVVDALPEVTFVQCAPAGTPDRLSGVVHCSTSTFREACGVLSNARAYLGPEGGMHHAAAALDVPAVVIFGGSPSVEATGYPDHVNLGGDTPCGRWQPCAHCAQVMAQITSSTVARRLKELLQ